MTKNPVGPESNGRMDVFCVKEYTGDDRRRHKRWTKIGAAFPHRDGLGGLNVLLDALPLDGSCVILPHHEEKNAAGTQETGAAE